MGHVYRQIEDSLFAIPPFYVDRSKGYRRADLIGAGEGSVHLSFAVSELAPGATVDACVHSYEKAIFVLDGEIELNRAGAGVHLAKFDYALIPVGTPYALRNRGGAKARLVEKSSPQPKRDGEWQDSFFVDPLAWPDDRGLQSATVPLAKMTGHFDKSQLPPTARIDDFFHGFSRKTLIDRTLLGSAHFDMFIIEFSKDGATASHDHNFEEAYLVLDGEGTFQAEGKSYVMRPGTVLWTGVGAAHGFTMDRGGSCCWLEVMSPQPPIREITRRREAWDRLRGHLAR